MLIIGNIYNQLEGRRRQKQSFGGMTEEWAPFGESAKIDLPLGPSAGMRCIGDKHIRIMTLRVPK